MDQYTVEARSLTKTYKVPVREAGLAASIKALFNRQQREVEAVKGIDFALAPGEVVGFLGPNGAGKTTTLKMLAGLLYPDAGAARVLGHIPERRHPDFLSRIALVMGNRNSLQWDLPAVDSFQLEKAIYDIPEAEFAARQERYVELLDVGELITKPVRNLSLGERMKMEIVAALLHQPEVLFLDEPTIGLDVTMQKRLRQFVLDYKDEIGATVLLTSHYMADVVAMCERVIVIHQGELLFDGDLEGLARRFSNQKTLTVTTSQALPDMTAYGEVVSSGQDKATLRVDRDDVARVAARVLADLDVIDLNIEDPPIEDVIESAFAAPGASAREEATTSSGVEDPA
jgi:ABC-2 type transport system ATP-binding protein